MKFFVVCDHASRVVDKANVIEAKRSIGCLKCCSFDLKRGEWRMGDVRAYEATADDERVCASALPAPERPKAKVKEPSNNLDWIGMVRL